MIGQTIRRYRILAKLGEGGMGVVYRAEDTKLDRAVALKFLPAHLLGNEDVRKRFEREAKSAAALDHPNVCHVYEIDEADGRTFISMSLIEGESLDENIAQGPLKLDEALSVAQQVSKGLEAAHKRGIIHRDIKPENIMVGDDGHVTIMDFGLAQLTEASRLTKTDETVGTVAYMSPEQTEGSGTDHRTDIWSLGVVLYEMVTGQQPFKGDYDKAVMYSILNEAPEPITGLRTGVPMELEALIGKCLAKQAADRYQGANEIAVDLRKLSGNLKSSRSTIVRTSSPAAGVPAATATDRTARPSRTWLWPAVATFLATVAIAAAFVAFRPETGTRPARLSIALPPGQEITSSPAISADGRLIAYTAGRGSDEPQLYLRNLDSFEARLVAGSSGAEQPFLSPDGQWVAFFAHGRLQKAEVDGGAPIPLAETPFPFGGTWAEDDTIIYTASIASGLLRIPASGGTPETLTKPDGAAAGYIHEFPQALPGGRAVLFSMEGQTRGCAVLSLDSGQWEIVLPLMNGESTIFDSSGGSSGRLLVTDGATGIRAAPFDAGHPTLTSADTSVLTDVYYDEEQRGWLAVSKNGTAVYAPGNPAKSSLVWVDHEGKTESAGAGQDEYRGVNLSPDGTKAAVKLGRTLWILDLLRGTRTHLTPGSAANHLPLWSRDGARVIFGSNRGGDWDIYSQPSDASQPAEALLTRPYDQSPNSVLADGSLLYEEVNPQTGFDLWTLSAGDPSQERKASPLRVSRFNESAGQVSPHSEGEPSWIAYRSDESGGSEIYVQSYPSGANRMPVSSGGGFLPRWSRDGRELFYVTGDAVVAVAIQPDGSFGAPRKLFDRASFFFPTRQAANYDVSLDGTRFLMVRRDPGSVPRQLNVILNWADEE